ncbi:hypothetical protein CRP125_gp38 [Roseobacter phage CRP-125]|uniref:Internal virion protein n=1 Tax=Roseobacter phage CRP-125 TaxID=3072844 RepID=A0AAX3ZYU4_9CAUD|nr:hypothetical protein CRP125_gp38 [Roseobacter phage CRP-125]
MADIQPIGDVEAAKRWLLENRDQIGGFEAKYGKGSAVAVLKGTYVAPEVEPEAEPSFLATAADQVTDVFQGITRGIMGAPIEMAETIANANSMGEDEAQALYDKTINYRNEVLAKRGLPAMTPEEEQEFTQRMGIGLASGGIAVRDERVDYDTQDVVDALGLTEALEVDTTAGTLAEGFSQFVSGYAMLGGGGGVLRSLATGAATDFAAFDPYDRNISAIMEENEWIIPHVTKALSTDADASEWENRLKNSVEGALLGVALEGTIATIKHFTKVKKAQAELAENGEVSEATMKELQEAEAEVTKFADLDGKPKGQVVEGKFVTDDGMIFDMNTGARDFEAEKVTLSQKTDAVASTDAPARPEAPESSTDAPRIEDPQGVAKAPETAPTAPKKPKPLVNTDVLVKAAKDAAKTKKPTTYNIQGERIGLFNWDNMEGPQDALKIMNSIGDTLSASGAMKNIEPQSLESINRAAMSELKDLTGADLPALTARFTETANSTSDLAVQLVAGKTALQSTGRRISQLVDEMDALDKAGRANSDVEERLVDALQLHADMQAAIKNIQTSAARATAAGRIRTADNITDAALNKVERFGGSDRLKKLAKKIKAAPTDAAKAKLVRKGVERTWLGKSIDVVNEVWLNAILSGPHTHALNIGANSINMMVRPAIRMVGGTLTGNGQQIEEGFRQYMYLTGEIANSLKTIATVGQMGGDTAIKNMMRSWWREEGILDTAQKFDGTYEGANRAISSQTLGGGSVVDFTGKAMRLAGRTLQAEDEMFKQLVFTSRLSAKVTTGARRMTDEQIQAAGYASREDYISGEIAKARESQESLAEKWQMMVQTGKVIDDAEAKAAFIQKHIGAYNHNSKYAIDALAEARETTFTTPLQNGTFSKYIQDMMTKIPILRQIMPFIQTPTNILRTSFERAPVLNMMMKKQRDMLLRGTPEERAIVIGNTAVGAMATFMAVNAAMQGRITGGGPSYNDELNKAKLWNASPDWQPYSINIGSTEEPQWIELRKLDPHGFLFGIVGDIYEMQQYMGDTKDPDLTKLTAMVVASFSNNVMSKTYMMSLSETLNIFDGSAKPYQIDQFLQNRVASLVPYSQLSYQLNQDMDDSARELRSLTDKVKARIYGMNNAAVKHDWLTGEDVGTPEYMLGFVRQKKVDSGEHKAAKVYSELRKLNHAFVGPQKKIGDITLSPEVFQRYNELVGTVQMTGRRTLLEQIEKTIDSRAYQKLADQAEIEQLRSADDPRVKLINQVIQLYKKRAQAQLYKEFPELAQAVNENKAIRKTIQAGGDASLSDNLIFEFPPQ